MKKYMKQITSWMCALLMTLSMAVPALAADTNAASPKLEVTGIELVSGSNTTLTIGSTDKLDFNITIKNDGVQTDIFAYTIVLKNADGYEFGVSNYFSGNKYPISSSTKTNSVSFDGVKRICDNNDKYAVIYNANEVKDSKKLSEIKSGTYKLSKICLVRLDGSKPEFDVSNSNITIEVKNPYAGNNNSTTTPTTSSKPTEDQIGGKYVSANVTTNAGGESTATVAMTDISSQVSANLSADSKAFAKELYNITVKSNYIPANSKIEAGKVLSGAVYTKVASAMSGVDGFRAFEINILNGSNVKVQPTGNGTVYVTVDLPSGYNKNTVAVYRINDDDSTPVKLNIVTRNDSNITFETDHFSTFVIAKNAITESNGYNDDYDDNDDDDTTVVPSQNNNTTTAASSTTAATSANSGTSDTTNMSPKTGDKAPLAALLFVMTCGGAICAVSVKKMIAR